MTETSPAELTLLLERWQNGEEQALPQLWPVVYQQLRELARHQFRREAAGHTLQPTALVNEAYVRLMGTAPGRIENRVHFFALAAKAMRQVLVDHARRKAASKRASHQHRVTLTDALGIATQDTPAVDTLALHDALEHLATFRPRAAQVVELRHFGGLTLEHTAEVLGVTTKTVGRDWQAARLWLLSRLQGTS